MLPLRCLVLSCARLRRGVKLLGTGAWLASSYYGFGVYVHDLFTHHHFILHDRSRSKSLPPFRPMGSWLQGRTDRQVATELAFQSLTSASSVLCGGVPLRNFCSSSAQFCGALRWGSSSQHSSVLFRSENCSSFAHQVLIALSDAPCRSGTCLVRKRCSSWERIGRSPSPACRWSRSQESLNETLFGHKRSFRVSMLPFWRSFMSLASVQGHSVNVERRPERNLRHARWGTTSLMTSAVPLGGTAAGKRNHCQLYPNSRHLFLVASCYY